MNGLSLHGSNGGGMGNGRICVIGAAPDSGNLGVTGACCAILSAIRERMPDADVTVIDHGAGDRAAEHVERGERFSYRRVGTGAAGAAAWKARVSSWTGRGRSLESLAIAGADLVLDAGSGDGLTDATGEMRFAVGAATRLAALASGKPLVLLPQAIGPFRMERARATAARIVRGAAMAWARDARSLGELRTLLGDGFDAARHGCAPDVGFALRAAAPAGLARGMQCWKPRLKLPGVNAVPEEPGDRPRVALHVSASLWNAGARPGVKADYREVMHGLLSRFLSRSDAGVLLVPHVRTQTGHAEHDADACADLAATTPSSLRRRVGVLEGIADPREVKWVLSMADWCCAGRVGVAVAALSAGVPCAGAAVSRKLRRVFEGCGLEGRVVDLRKVASDAAAEGLWRMWEARAADREILTAGRARREETLSGVFDAALMMPRQASGRAAA